MAKSTARPRSEEGKATAGAAPLGFKTHPMTPLERRSVTVMASIYGLRIFGLFLIFPVFALYAAHLQGQTPVLIGWAMGGAYGLTQAILQIPLGSLSDHIGRKPVIAVGLLVLAVGSIVAALSHTISGVIIGRAIQGGGAISAAAMALAADLTREEQRTKAMAAIGITVGAAFLLSMILSPVLDAIIGVSGIFWLTAVLASTAIAVLVFAVPTPARTTHGATLAQFLAMLKDRQLLALDFGIFSIHLVMTALFLVIPDVIIRYGGLPRDAHWKLYLPVMLLAVVTMAPFMRMTNRGKEARVVLIASIVGLTIAELLFFFGYREFALLVVGLWLFFTTLSLLEASLPSLISRVAPASGKGAAIGVYSTAQFLGIFAGGVGGGRLHEYFGTAGVFLGSIAVLVIWLIVTILMPPPKLLVTHLLKLSTHAVHRGQALAGELERLPGVAEVVVLPEEQLAYLKVDPGLFDARHLESFQA